MNTIIEKIRAEVERLMRENSSSSGLEGGVLDLTYEDGIDTALNDVLEILNTLQEQPVEWNEDEFAHLVGCMIQDIVANEKDNENYGVEKKPTRFFVEKYKDRFKSICCQSKQEQSKPEVRFPHEKDIVDKVFGAGNLDGWEYDEAKALVALAKEELLKDIKPKVSEELEEEINRCIYKPFFDLDGVAVKGATYYLTVEDVADIARHFAKWGAEHLKK